ncbi:MAG: FHA domain-containing protein [Roseburia sp.]
MQMKKENGEKLVIFEAGNVRIVSLEDRMQWSLGRKTSKNHPDIPMVSPIVSRDHGTFVNSGGQWYFIDNPDSRNGTFYNGKKIKSPMNGKRKLVLLKEGDMLWIGENDVRMIFLTGAVLEAILCDRKSVF